MADEITPQKSGIVPGKWKLGLIGCGLIALILLALFFIVFIFGQFAANPRF